MSEATITRLKPKKGDRAELIIALRNLAFHAGACAMPNVSDMQRGLTRMSIERAQDLLLRLTGEA